MTSTPAVARVRELSADEIARLLPHRYPFFLLDRVTSVEPGVRAEAIKSITASDPVLAGHFPGRMLYPGVLLVECVAQLAAVIYGSAAATQATGEPVADVAERVGYLAEIKQAKFLRTVVPGDQLVIRAQTGPRLRDLMSVIGQASVGREVVMTTRLVVTERNDSQ
ncbi:3-hydroxyacyl-ACP dehydratase FabZ [Kribbella solani]|uniref:3-hydroxyacyl-[acyl-carrier-protein] dehydratase n=1 Tax=Kribbella solani TaxID=236067 RepID=A0A841DL31_9ACTN|nr:3-hydroxyacyl-ACP dehydratase FabZ [Kribbella solani]MBB5977380.1 3-hydroxyacyl-[acyl-carrier-protein] dehydratase [Kribbella solani]MDX2969752.1 3-hydroxyacyl-ACP dehydratase FabZ [Kribbella solani]MDX3001697.1 3-hydroxyacyl-ACP dehydratase FabZ [Kribbella solani]